MFESSIQELLVSRALERIASADALEDLEPVRVEFLGRKGAIDQFFKQMGKLAPEERARAGKLLNQAKQELEAAVEARKEALARQTLDARLEGGHDAGRAIPAQGRRAEQREFRCHFLQSGSGRYGIGHFVERSVGGHTAIVRQLLRLHTHQFQQQ